VLRPEERDDPHTRVAQCIPCRHKRPVTLLVLVTNPTRWWQHARRVIGNAIGPDSTRVFIVKSPSQ
jgi:hypothetical protein